MRKALLTTLVVTSLALISSCERKAVDNYQSLCERLVAEEMPEIEPEFAEALRDELVRQYHEHHTAIFANAYPSLQSKEFAELRLAGAWRDGAHLHLADWTLITVDDSDPAIERWAAHLREVFTDAKTFDREVRCAAQSTLLVFEDITLHGSAEKTVVLRSVELR